MEAANKLSDRGIAVRVVSMPCQDWFEQQTQEYQDSVLPPDVTARVAVEAGIRQSWDRYLGRSGRFVGMDRFGASAPFEELYERFGITSGRVIDAAVEAIG
jgi:transketolase